MMTKLKTTFFLCFFSIAIFYAQEKDYTISINNHTITTNGTFEKQKIKKEIQKTRHSRGSSSQQPYVLIQFFKTPTSKELNSLKRKGVIIKSHFEKTTYFAKISSNFYTSKVRDKNIRTVLAIKPKYKLNPVLLKRNIPFYAQEGSKIKVVITCFDIHQKTIDSDLLSYGITTYRISEDFNQVIAQINKSKLLKIASLPWVQNIELTPPPSSVKNKQVQSSNRVNVMQSTISDLGYNLTGKGVKIGLWDANVQKHVDCSGRLVNREYEIESSHGSHVFGTMAGAGLVDPKGKGVAPEAKVFTWNFNVSSNGLYVYEERLKSVKEDGIEFTQNSFGDYVRTPISLFRYSVDDRGDDAVTVKKPYLLNIYANGNDQALGKANEGFSTSSKNSKNSLHVGANDKNEKISNYSSFGPTADGRIIPQVSAIGTNVYSMVYGNRYATMSGTSMSTPGVSGTVALLYERYKAKNGGKKPLASLIKGIVSNTARDMGNTGPDYKYGYGNINGLRALRVIDNKQYFINSIANNQEQEQTITVPQGVKKLKIMLCYSDLPGVAGSSKILVNDLDLKVFKDGKTYLPWVLNPSNPSKPATKGLDRLNNMEQITIDNPTAGNYKIVVKGKEIPLNTQQYTVTYDFLTPQLNLIYPIGREFLNPKDIEYIRWDYIGDDKTFTLEYSTDNGKTYKIITDNLPSDVRNYKWIVPNTISKNAKVRVIAGSKASSSKECFHIMTRPQNLKSSDDNHCGVTSFTMDWDKVANAKYEILKLKDEKEFVKIAETTTNSYNFINTKSGANNWYTVRAVDLTTGAVSERAIAIKLNPRTSPVLTPANLPYNEDFEALQINNFSFSTGDKKTGYAGLGYYDSTLKNAALMGGHGESQATPWVKSIVAGHGFATITNAFIDNPTYIKRMKYCGVDATQLSGEKITLNFDLKYNCPTGSSNKIFFRVLVNGRELISTDKKRYYHGINGDYKPFYDLSAYAGTKFDLTFEAVIDDKIQNKATSQAIILAIDNVKIARAKNDVAAIYGHIPVKKAVSTDTEVPVTIRVQNFSSNIVTNIPVSYTINGGQEVKEIITKKLYPFNSYNYTFKKKADFSKQNAYKVVLSVKYPNDEKKENDSFALKEVINLGSDIVLGESPSTEGNPLYTYTTCSATFTDDGTRFNNYKNLAVGFIPKVAIFKPTEKGKKVKVDFSEFELEKDADYLRIYNGASIDDPLLMSLTGSEMPPSITSTAEGGALTFQFVPSTSGTAKGWIANIKCVNPNKTEEAQIVRITKPEIINKKTATTVVKIKVKNLGEKTRINLPVFYQVNGGTKIEEIITEPIKPLEEKEYTFKATTDMSKKSGDFKYVIKAGINEQDVIPKNNTLEMTVYNKYKLPKNTNTDGYGIVELSWGKFTKKSNVSGYSDFKSEEIVVFKEKKYNPTVKVSKPEVPISKFFNNSLSGIFTIMVVDLNNDGDYSDEFYKGHFWVNTEITETNYSTKTTHFFKKALDNEEGVVIPEDTPVGKHPVRFIHMFREPNENYSVILGPTKDNVNTSREDFEVEEYTLNIQNKPMVDASITKITAVPRREKESSVAVDVTNNSKKDITNFEVTYKIDGGAEITQKITENIIAGGTQTIVFNAKANLKEKKSYKITASVKLPNDGNASNNTKIKIVKNTVAYSKNVVGTFNGYKTYMAASSSSKLDLTNNYTVEAWINQTAEATFIKGGGLPRIIDKNTVKVFINNKLSQSYVNNSFVFYFMTDKGEYILNTNENTVKLNRWQHIAVSVSANNKYNLYIDGKSVPYKFVKTENSTTIAGAALSNVNDLLYIGNQKSENRGFEGYIDEVRVWKGVINPQDISKNMTKAFTGKESNLLAYYPISGSSEMFEYDYSTYDNTAIIGNADINGVGEDKFRKVPKLLQSIKAVNQIASKYDAQTKTYTIHLPKTTNASEVVLDYDLQMYAVAKIGNVIQENKVTKNDFTTPLQVTIKGVGFNKNVTETYTVKVLAGQNDEAKLLGYDFLVANNSQLSEDVKTTIDGISVVGKVKANAKDNLIATFKTSSKATLYIDGEKQENGKTHPVNYNEKIVVTVVSEDGLNKTFYEITLKDKPQARKEKVFTVNVYPNPVTEGRLNIVSNAQGIKTIFIYTLSGNQLLRLETSTNEINLSELSDGTYLLKIIQDKKIKNKMIVIKRK